MPWGDQMSNFHPQKFGISQGCPLSSFLFSILMTVLMHDCRAKLGDIPMELAELLYADDTLLIARPLLFACIIIAGTGATAPSLIRSVVIA